MTTDKILEKKQTIITKFAAKAKKLTLGSSKPFIQEIHSLATSPEKYYYRTITPEWVPKLYSAYEKCCGYPANTCNTLEDFFHPQLYSGLEKYFGKEEAKRIKDECELILESPYNMGYYRPSYRSKKVGDYAEKLFNVIIEAIEYACYDISLIEATKGSLWLRTLEYRIALALKQEDPKILAMVEEAIMGEGSTANLYKIIGGVVKSGHQQALEWLGKLLLAAKGQEGVRQGILEACDTGTIDSHQYFISLILEHKLCRFSAVIRAFDTWTGLGFGDQKQKVVEKHMALAHLYLTDENALTQALDSNDVVEIYMSLWAKACHDVNLAMENAKKLLQAKEKYRRLVAWYFITSLNNSRIGHQIAINYLDVRDKEELAWICANLYINPNVAYHGSYGHGGEKISEEERYKDLLYPSDKAKRNKLFKEITEVMDFNGKKKTVFETSVFPWVKQTLNNEQTSMVLLGLMAYDFDEQLNKEILDRLPLMDSRAREVYFQHMVNPKKAKGREILLKGLSDRSQWIRENVLKKLENQNLNSEEIKKLTDALSTKSASFKKAILTLLSNQKETLILPAIDELLDSPNKSLTLAGAELLNIFIKKNPTLKEKYKKQITSLLAKPELSKDLIMALEQIQPSTKKKEEYSEENGYGLYDKTAPIFTLSTAQKNRPTIPKRANKELQALIVPDKKEVKKLFHKIIDVLEKYADYEYEGVVNFMGTREKVLLGQNQWRIIPLVQEDFQGKHIHSIHDYPLAKKWLEAAGEYASDKEKLLVVLSLFENDSYGYARIKFKSWVLSEFKGYPIEDNGYFKESKVRDNYHRIRQILEAIYHTETGEGFKFAFEAYVNLVEQIPLNRLDEPCEKEEKNENTYYYGRVEKLRILQLPYLYFWRHMAYKNIKTDEQFTDYFNEMWYQYLAANEREFYGLQPEDLFRAHSLGLIPDEGVHRYLLSGGNMHTITSSWGNKPAMKEEILGKYPKAKELLNRVTQRVVSLEIGRGELATPLTRVAMGLHAYEGGIEHFVNLLTALGDTGFYRGYYWGNYWGEYAPTKQQTLSHLLRNCQPKKGETPQQLKEALKKAKITENRIIQAAIYTPIWAGIIEEALNISGLKSGVWFFHAHVNEGFSAEKETEVAIYSAITPQQFVDGTFDKDWFYHAYETLGEKRFQTLYKNAKYITASNIAHKRSQRYTDAALGRLSIKELEQEITEKRNQEKLRAYALIPLDSQNPNDALERYEFIMKFQKESRGFGAQRKASEGKACLVALENLAITTDYKDVDRMIWALEGEKIKQLEPLMKPSLIGECEIYLDISKEGTPSIKVRKNGKELKSIPKALAKEEQVVNIKEAVKELRNQKSRAKESFEKAMISSTEFKGSEIKGLLNHPVLKGMVSNLVFCPIPARSNPSMDAGADRVCPSANEDTNATKPLDNLGFPTLLENNLHLKNTQGKTTKLEDETKLRIAHPHDLIQENKWSDYQRYLYQEQIVQPFKQVFREYYPLTADEKAAKNTSLRYAGHQIQPQKTVALLKNRGWTVDYDEGLQRVWHKENLITRMYAMADWFSPAEIEAPTLENVQFFRRDKWGLVDFENIPPIIFSETMRDIDLVVSVAHAGGVDPEASHSTIEMRIAMTKELLKLLTIENVSFQKAHAHIKGNLGEYSIHMGSGVIHKKGTGMIAVLPVHSQGRGRIFLPFVDDDPKTAEILSKILLFAEDKKIKDPAILEQLKG